MAVLNSFEICNPADPGIIQSYPDVVYNGENFQLVWSDEKFGTYYVTAGRVSPGGVVLDTGVCVSSGTGSYEYQPKIAYDGERCFVIWPKDLGIQGRFLNLAGQPEGSVFSITGSGYGPVIAYGGANYLAAWFSGSFPTLNIKTRLFSTSGVPLGTELNVTTDGDCNRWPDIVFDGRRFVIVWTKGANSPASQYVWGQVVSTGGDFVGGNFPISSNAIDQRWFPAIASSDTNYLITWGQSGAASNIMGNVDHELAAVKEDFVSVKAEPVFRGPTIVKRLPKRLNRGDVKILDISGRPVDREKMAGGVYFVKLDGANIQKIIIIK